MTHDELSALATGDRAFVDVTFAPGLSLDDLDLAESRFERCRFALPAVRGANFSESTFKDCHFAPSRFANCKFARAKFAGCTLFDVEKKAGSTFAFCEMHSLIVEKCNLATCTFDRCDLYDIGAVDSSFRGARFVRSSFTKVLSRRSTVTQGSFERCNMSFADLSGLHLQSATFRACRLSEASFIDTDLSDANLLECALDRVEWDKTKLANADLSGSQLAGLNLTVLADYAGLTISESEQSSLLEQLGIRVVS
jgi:fluoroquinolone resistance protein